MLVMIVTNNYECVCCMVAFAVFCAIMILRHDLDRFGVLLLSLACISPLMGLYYCFELD